MTADEIDAKLLTLAQALIGKDPQAAGEPVVELIGLMLKNQQRIADSLEKLADCVRPPKGYSNSAFEIRGHVNG